MPTSTPRVPIIDVCGGVFDAVGWRSYLTRFAFEAPGYLRGFGRRLALRSGIAAEAYDDAVASQPETVVDMLVEHGGLAVSLEEHVHRLRQQGVVHQVLQGGSPDKYDVDLNARVASWAAQAPDLLQAWCGLNLADPTGSVSELERCVGPLGARGVYLTPFFDGIPADDDSCMCIYQRAEELGVPVWVHTGMTLASNRPISLSTWAHIDRLAVRFPELTLIAGHGGWPWVLEGMAVLQRHPNVYLDFSAYRPAYISRPGSGWEPLLNYGRSILSHKILFGSVSWVHRLTIRELADEVLDLPIGADAAHAWLHDNAARILGLPGE